MPRSQKVMLRIPTEDLERARRLAAQRGLGYQTYIKRGYPSPVGPLQVFVLHGQAATSIRALLKRDLGGASFPSVT
jgi:hypothetical protein